MRTVLVADVKCVCYALEHVSLSRGTHLVLFLFLSCCFFFFFSTEAAVTQTSDMPTARLHGQIWLRLALKNSIRLLSVAAFWFTGLLPAAWGQGAHILNRF